MLDHGGGGGHTQKLTTMHYMKHLMQEANSFSIISWACAVTLNPFVAFGKCVCSRQLYTNIFGKNYWLINFFSFESVHGDAMLKMGWVVKKWKFSFWTASNWAKCILMVSWYIWLSIYTNNEILGIIWKFDLSSRGVLGRIYALSIEVLCERADPRHGVELIFLCNNNN